MTKRRRGETLLDFAVTMSGMLGAGIMPVILIKTTTFPIWASFLIGIPSGTIVGWLTGGISIYGVCAVLRIVLAMIGMVQAFVRKQ